MAESRDEPELLRRIAELQEQLNTPIQSNTSAEGVDRGEERAKEVVNWHTLNERVVSLEEQVMYAHAPRWHRLNNRFQRLEERLDYLVALRKAYKIRSVIAMGFVLAFGITCFTSAILAIVKMF
jgi:uncharacterized coiled-coil DUF342 family protein